MNRVFINLFINTSLSNGIIISNGNNFNKLLSCSNSLRSFYFLSKSSFDSSSSSSPQLCLYVKKEKLNLYEFMNPTRNSSSTSLAYLNKEWSKILTKAEKVVGYPTSFLNLRYLVSDEVAHFANLLRKLMKTKHPLIKMARRFLISSDNESKRNLQINGLIVLLISKAAGIPKKNNIILDSDILDGIHQSQRRLAEIAEMIYMGSLIHKGVLDLKTIVSNEKKDLDQGNKLAVLFGDYLLASACSNLSKLHNTEVVDLMSQVIADISQGTFTNQLDTKFTHLKLWYDNVNSNSSSLLANSARASMLLVRHSSSLQDVAYNFAKNLDLTHKIWSELMDYKNDNRALDKPDTILNAIYKDNYQMLLNENKLQNNKKINSIFKFNFISAGEKSSPHDSSEHQTESQFMEKKLFTENILNDCKNLFNYHYSSAIKSLQLLENENSESDALSSLKSILNVMKNTI